MMILVERGRGVLSNSGEGKDRKEKICKLPAEDYIIAVGHSAEQDPQQGWGDFWPIIHPRKERVSTVVSAPPLQSITFQSNIPFFPLFSFSVPTLRSQRLQSDWRKRRR